MTTEAVVRAPSTLAADLVRRQVAVIAATSGVSPALAAKAATTSIPVVFVVGPDPVRLGLVASLARPDGNLTGINFFSTEVTAKRLELLRELVPAATRVAVMINPADAEYTETTVREVGAAARTIGLQIQVLKASTISELNATFATFVSERPDALFVGSDPFFNSPYPIGPPRDAPRDPSVISSARLCRSRWPDELRGQYCGCVAPGRLLCRPHPQGRQAHGLASCAVEQVRTGYQRPDRHNARSNRAGQAARRCRRGDRVNHCKPCTLSPAAYVPWWRTNARYVYRLCAGRAARVATLTR